MRDFSQDHRWLSINTATLRRQCGQEAPLTDIIALCARRGVRAISPWRDQVQAVGLERVRTLLRDEGMALSGYCRGGFFTGATPQARQAALEDNRRAMDEARALEAPCLVLVVGALPGALQGAPQYKDIARARQEVRDGLAASLDYARQIGLPLAIEPLHPMQAADRACVNTLAHALDLCEELDPLPAGAAATLGVALDVYHVWWDPALQAQIARAGRQRLLAYHVCDWRLPTRDLLSDRAMMGDGIIELRKIRGWVEAAGYEGYAEVEIFSEADWWQRPGGQTLDTCIERHREAV